MKTNKPEFSQLQSNALTIAILLNTILVVLRHCFNLHKYYNEGNPWMEPSDWNVLFQLLMIKITNIAIPFFFLISGFLFFNHIDHINDCLVKIKRRFTTLVLPYFIWNLLLLTLCLILSAIPALRSQIAHIYNLEYSIFWIVARLTYKPIIGQFWYIRTLFIFMVFSPLYLYMFKSRACSFLALLLSIVLWRLIDTGIISTEGVCFFLLGGVLRYHGALPMPSPCKNWLWLLMPQIAIFLILIFNSFKYIYLQKACMFVQLYVGWQICLYLASKTKLCHFLVELNHHSFFLYATHVTIIKVLSQTFARILPHAPQFSFMAYLLCFSMTLALSLTMSFCTRRSLPHLYSMLTGGR